MARCRRLRVVKRIIPTRPNTNTPKTPHPDRRATDAKAATETIRLAPCKPPFNDTAPALVGVHFGRHAPDLAVEVLVRVAPCPGRVEQRVGQLIDGVCEVMELRCDLSDRGRCGGGLER